VKLFTSSGVASVVRQSLPFFDDSAESGRNDVAMMA
jgi:hypothetical protein